jgi:hypothetical protein
VSVIDVGTLLDAATTTTVFLSLHLSISLFVARLVSRLFGPLWGVQVCGPSKRYFLVYPCFLFPVEKQQARAPITRCVQFLLGLHSNVALHGMPS